jgi:hypothetical protein
LRAAAAVTRGAGWPPQAGGRAGSHRRRRGWTAAE